MNRHQIYKALIQKQTFLGCERSLCMFLILICIALVLSSADILVSLMSGCLFICGFYLLRIMSEHDLMLSKVYLKQLKYAAFYLAQGRNLNNGGWKKK
ncbi:VirB3 family type IV secretion system protein [Succinatimonas hippei]|uniref:Conjugal transfer protein TrbD n=1 Tax=Succinatimonas hippei (strain DSM 22608 / JCM 16073 / KCTC 15190 / YIT 12066) TaxID=762983 RepID=E8LKG9_SUCHY|nr:VirB3 family type IV secretion system protein [Succinatimonas hippei]EFY06956.1 conjugal transfer protein TrbD [Succinatimonas hippei YIT 12066]